MSKLWQKQSELSKEVEDFTTGNDRYFDLVLAPYDVIGSLAHCQMLQSVGLLSTEDLNSIQLGLKDIFHAIESDNFTIDEDVEDVHSQIELMLTNKIGDAGKKIHSARSRNDQVLVDLKMFLRNEIMDVVADVADLFMLLISNSNRYKDHLLPGYTHLQLAMPSSFGLWFGAYAESLSDDLIQLHAAYEVVNKNPLGSAAGYGSSFPINRKVTTELLGFDDLHYNVVYAQMSRGKTEKLVAAALGNIAATISKLAMDAVLFMNQNFGYISFPDELTTGSSIMPHKKNPDVFELIRAKCNMLQTLSAQITLLTTNLPSGYHRDLQIIKEQLFPAFEDLHECIQMMILMLSNIQVKEDILKDDRYQLLFTVEEVNKLVLSGTPFRDAYKQVAAQVESGDFKADRNLAHTHEGSMGNLCNDFISERFENVLHRFNFSKVEAALEKLLH
jgi:argininosuccinate lyase